MNIGIPIAGMTDPASRRSNKIKALGELDKYEVESKSVYRSFRASTKMLDGVTKIFYSFDGCCNAPSQEFTSFDKFKAAIVDELEGIKVGLEKVS